MNPRRTLHGGVEVLLGLCHTKPIKAHKHHLGGGNTKTQHTILFSEYIKLCLFVKFADLGIGEVFCTHQPDNSRLSFHVTKRRRTKERGLSQQDYTRRFISFPYNWRRLWELQTEQNLLTKASPLYKQWRTLKNCHIPPSTGKPQIGEHGVKGFLLSLSWQIWSPNDITPGEILGEDGLTAPVNLARKVLTGKDGGLILKLWKTA